LALPAYPLRTRSLIGDELLTNRRWTAHQPAMGCSPTGGELLANRPRATHWPTMNRPWPALMALRQAICTQGVKRAGGCQAGRRRTSDGEELNAQGAL